MKNAPRFYKRGCRKFKKNGEPNLKYAENKKLFAEQKET